jgi:hypothetical protein
MPEANDETGASMPHAQADPEMAAELQALEGKVSAIDAELTKHEAADKMQQTPTRKPSMGRIVIVRHEHHVDAPGIITAVREDGTIDVQVFCGDHLPHVADRLLEIHPPEADSSSGWFWPPRV